MTGKMKTGLIAGAAAVIVLSGAVTALVLTKDDGAAEEDTSSQTAAAKEKTSKLLYDKDPKTITHIELKKKDSSFAVDQYGDTLWTITEIKDLPLDYTVISGIVDETASVTAAQTVVEKADDISIYGLSDPQLTVTAQFGDITRTLTIGNEIPSGKEYYFLLDDSEVVYTIAAKDIQYLLYDEYDCINKLIYSPVEDNDTEDDYDPARVNSITIKRKDLDYDIRLEYDTSTDDEEIISGNTSTHMMTEPVSLGLNPDRAANVLSGIFGLTADDIAAVKPTDADLEEFGLKDPLCEVDFDINARSVTLIFGNACTDEDGKKTGYYGMAKGIDNVVYSFSDASVPWVEVMPLDIAQNMVTSKYIFSVDSIEITTDDGRKEHFDISSEDASTLLVKHNGTDFADVDNFKSFYRYILSTPAEEIYTEECTGEPRAVLSIKSGKLGDDIIEFFPGDDRMTVIRLNGKPSFRCRTTFVDRLIENLDHLLAGEDIISTW